MRRRRCIRWYNTAVPSLASINYVGASVSFHETGWTTPDDENNTFAETFGMTAEFPPKIKNQVLHVQHLAAIIYL